MQRDWRFQSTPPRGERLQAAYEKRLLNEFQSTPPRGERHLFLVRCDNLLNFNPRPREGSDVWGGSDGSIRNDFNPRPREGSDRIYLPLCNHKPDFNPRPREGSDHHKGVIVGICIISIHAPARGATPRTSQQHCCALFQSTPPRGERRRLRSIARCFCYFNPRPREGSDSTFPMCCLILIISIHAPARGATPRIL